MNYHSKTVFSEYQVVRLTRRIESFEAGTVGTIVMVYDSPERTGYEVELFNADHDTIGLVTVYAEDIEAHS
ncbi:DUF4926 domain-containing protein [Occallatibacter riparius]|uniref:DUF4926 domain-containing protein n=1 Tax=Occallatibacter riparius TaxID=1002689 RepID=A0A9J7BQ22_9BACT|nr:DUF4926 domain-containing protein [Occallatibacter riparius]UWZ84883.1 DUF4926 domain-containing protein [Occallatibacter riparius]